jgi:hypothetical protein
MGTGDSFSGAKAQPGRDADHYLYLVPSAPSAFMACSGTALAFYTEWSKSHETHKSVTREKFTIMLVVILILYVGTTAFSPRATGAGATLTAFCTPLVE